MEGTILIYHAFSDTAERHILTRPPGLKYLQGCVGGLIEHVPCFDTIEDNGEMHDCIVYADEEGKLKGAEYNAAATRLWRLALRRDYPETLLDDVLVGSIVVLYGDAEFMSEL